jgi:hypothetical protein
MGLIREFETVSEKKKSETRFFSFLIAKMRSLRCGSRTRPEKIRISGNETPNGSRNRPAYPVFWVSKLIVWIYDTNEFTFFNYDPISDHQKPIPTTLRHGEGM